MQNSNLPVDILRTFEIDLCVFYTGFHQSTLVYFTQVRSLAERI